MLNIISPTLQSASATLVTPNTPSFFRIKSTAAGGGSGARRALAALGSNNAQLNMNMAVSHLAMAQEGFASRWNFNPEKEVPLAPGRYQWAPLVSIDKNTPVPSANIANDSILLKDISNPTLTCSPPLSEIKSTNNPTTNEGDNEISCTVSTPASDQENSENEAKPEIKYKQVLGPSCEMYSVSKKNVTSSSQMCLTDFFRPSKRKSCNQHEGCHPNTGSSTPPKKKLRTIH